MDFIQKTYANRILKPFLKFYLRKERTFHYQNLSLEIYPGVFHPGYFFSTLMLARFLEEKDLKGRSFCEVGAGSGLLSFIAYSKAGIIHCLDISETAVKGLDENLRENFPQSENFSIYHSDLFTDVPPQQFDLVVINPPYFFKQAGNQAEQAWYCGINGEYFSKLFSQLPGYIHPSTEIYMILAENCELERIKDLAKKADFNMVEVRREKIKWEKNFIFKLNLVQRAGPC